MLSSSGSHHRNQYYLLSGCKLGALNWKVNFSSSSSSELLFERGEMRTIAISFDNEINK